MPKRIVLTIVLFLMLGENPQAQDFWLPPVEVPGNFVTDLEFDDSGNMFFVSDALYKTDPLLQSWTVALDEIVRDFRFTGTEYLAATWLDGLFKSTDADAWAHRLEGIALNAVGFRDNDIVVGGGAGQVFISSNGGTSWTVINPSELWKDDDDINRIEFTPLTFVYTQGFIDDTIIALDPASQNGNQWIVDTLPDSRDLQSDGNTIQSSSGETIFTSQNGIDWIGMATVPTIWPLWTFDVDQSNIIAGDIFGGLFFSKDNGQTWSDASSGFTDNDIDIIRIGPDGHAYAVNNNNIYRSTNPLATSTATEPRQAGIPVESDIQAVYPNPMRGHATIDILLRDAGPVSLSVYDIGGREVSTIFSGTLSIGKHRINWSSDLAAGMYFVQLESSTGLRTISVVVGSK